MTGRVQGVGFRFFVLGVARRHGLTGNVRNLSDGSVRVEATGDPPALDALLEALHKGPPLSRVEDVMVDREAVIATGDRFEILAG